MIQIKTIKKSTLLIIIIAMATILGIENVSAQSKTNYQRLVKIVVDSTKLEAFKAALKEGTETAVRLEPGVLSYNIFQEKEHPNHITIFETYASIKAYNKHIQTQHFKNYKTKVADMVQSLELIDVDQIAYVTKQSKSSTMKNSENKNAIFPKGEKASPDYFTGTAWIKNVLPNDDTLNTIIADVTFEPKARNHWHKHPGGQILIVTDGIGYYQEKGKPIQLLHKGDVVKILPNAEHWHGASPDSEFTHIAIIPNTQKGIVEWLQAVTDAEYNSFK